LTAIAWSEEYIDRSITNLLTVGGALCESDFLAPSSSPFQVFFNQSLPTFLFLHRNTMTNLSFTCSVLVLHRVHRYMGEHSTSTSTSATPEHHAFLL
jgi:hypothetical protein